ncbi:hypothetical protein NEUTE2DRAFT_132479 [Neurospora tetrasperma FGSC 2509]|nr:hypothetical protein NEUTE2DRAFT_132479 [Neurospora tetrasperma FGSC 2509]
MTEDDGQGQIGETKERESGYGHDVLPTGVLVFPNRKSSVSCHAVCMPPTETWPAMHMRGEAMEECGEDEDDEEKGGGSTEMASGSGVQIGNEG